MLLVHRVSDSLAETRVVNLKELIKTESFSEDQTIRSDDIVIVPQNEISKIERFVKWGNVGIYATPAIH